MAIIHSGISHISSNYPVGPKKPIPQKTAGDDPSLQVGQDSLGSINFAAAGANLVAAAPAAAPPAVPTPPVLAALPQAPAAPQGTAFGFGGSLLMTEQQPEIQESSSIDGFLARIANGAKQGMESSGKVLQRAMVDAAGLGHRLGKSLGCDERNLGLSGAAGTAISFSSALVGGAMALPLALIAGVADGVSAR